ncbi:MAG: hypothetical protein ABIH74_03720, partial [Candidatus Omnitrophota bacterium]
GLVGFFVIGGLLALPSIIKRARKERRAEAVEHVLKWYGAGKKGPEAMETRKTAAETAVEEVAQPETPPETVEPVVFAGKTARTRPIFVDVELRINNDRARLEEDGNTLRDFFVEQGMLPFDAPRVDRNETTARMRAYLERLLETAEELAAQIHERGEMSHEDDETVIRKNILIIADILRDKIDTLETDSILASLITLARKAEREGQELIIGLETDWVPGYEKGRLQYDAMNPFVRKIDALGDTLRAMGLENVSIVHTESEKLADAVLNEIVVKETEFSNVVIMASERTVLESAREFEIMRKSMTKSAFFAVVDTTELEKADIADMNVFAVQFTEMLTLTLELAAGREAPANSALVVFYDKLKREVVFMPRAVPENYEDLRARNMRRKRAIDIRA